MSNKVGRNDPCPCGSGKKYKNCHLNQKQSLSTPQKVGLTFCGLLILVGIVYGIRYISHYQFSEGKTRVWSEEHQHYHYE